MIPDSFLTISKSSKGFYKEKGSKFLGFAFPVVSEEETKEKLAALRKEYYDARHHCYAYIHGNEGQHVRANDDGEPNHSAGDPILGQIKSNELTNTLIVVIRYLGGIKLGVSGLINAYKTAAAEAIENNKIVKKDITSFFQFSFPYDEMNEVMKLVKDLNLNIKNQGFENDCTLDVEVIVSKIEVLNTKVQLLIDTGHKIKLK
jgi:uncharacterized YigZ family protein